MKKRQVVSIALASAMAASMGLSAAAATDVAATDLAYKGELELMHYSTSEEAGEMVDLMHSVLQSLTGKQLIRTSH